MYIALDRWDSLYNAKEHYTESLPVDKVYPLISLHIFELMYYQVRSELR